MIAHPPLPSAPAPEITAALDRPVVNMQGGSVRHLVITVRAPSLQPCAEPRGPLNLGIVIDASGSMEGPPLMAAKAATLALLDKLADADHVSLVSFASDVILHAEAVRLDAAGRDGIREAIRPLVTRGNTNLSGGWLGGCEAVARRQAASERLERNHVILLSDGHANIGETDPGRLAHHAGELRNRGVLSSTVGIGQHYSPLQLQAVAEAGGGRMHDAEHAEEIAEIMSAELNDMLTTALENLELSFRLPPGVEPEIYGPTPLNRDAEGCDILAGSMVAGTTRRIVVKLKFPAGGAGDAASIHGAGRWKAPGECTVHSLTIGPVAARFESADACRTQSRCGELARAVAEQWQAHIYHRAMQLNLDGRRDEAADFVSREAAFFRSYCEAFPGLRSSVAAIQTFGPTLRHAYQPISSKEVLLHAYKLSRSEADHRRVRRRRPVQDLIDDEARRAGS